MRRATPLIGLTLVIVIAAALLMAHPQADEPTRVAPPPVASSPPAPASPSPSPSPRADVDRHDPLGRPVSHERELQIVERPAYTLGYDNRARLAAWVSYRLAGAAPPRGDAAHGDDARDDAARGDDAPARATPEVAVRRPAAPEDFAVGGFDGASLVPPWLFASRGDADGARSATLASTIAPMHRGLRLGLWRELARRIDGWAARAGEVWVTAGPVHAYGEATLPAGEPVPSGFFLVVVRRDGAGWSALAFAASDDAQPPAPERFLVPLARIERETGLEFAPALPAAAHAALAAQPASAPWP